MIKTRTKWLVFLFCLVISVFFGVNIAMVLNPSSAIPINCGTSSLYRIEIDLLKTTLEEINSGDKDTKYPGNTATISTCNGDKIYRDVEIKGRGNSTWMGNKKPYQIKFADKVDLFGMGKARKWILLANAFDESNLRTDAAFYIEKMLEEPYALEGEFAELIVNGEYLGLYYVTQKVEIGKTRVNISDPLGILVELDNLHNNDDTFEVSGNTLLAKDVVSDDYLAEAKADFAHSLKRLKKAVDKKDIKSMKKYVDIDSVVRYYLLSEFTVNPDAYYSSFYMYKDGKDDKIHFGPGWDFDFSMGNRNWVWSGSEDFYLPEGQTIKDYYGSKRAKRIFWFVENKEFEELVGEMYREKLAGRKQELLDYIDERAGVIYQAALHNAGRWHSDFDKSLEELKEWISGRFDYFDELYGDKSSSL